MLSSSAAEDCVDEGAWSWLLQHCPRSGKTLVMCLLLLGLSKEDVLRLVDGGTHELVDAYLERPGATLRRHQQSFFRRFLDDPSTSTWLEKRASAGQPISVIVAPQLPLLRQLVEEVVKCASCQQILVVAARGAVPESCEGRASLVRPDAFARHGLQREAGTALVVFTTYHSFDKVHEGLRGASVSLLCLDEAHKLAGWTEVLDILRAHRQLYPSRLYMTATPDRSLLQVVSKQDRYEYKDLLQERDADGRRIVKVMHPILCIQVESEDEGSRKRSPAEKTRGMLFELMEEERHIRKVLCYFPRANGRSDDSSSEDDETDAEPPIAVATEATPTV